MTYTRTIDAVIMPFYARYKLIKANSFFHLAHLHLANSQIQPSGDVWSKRSDPLCFFETNPHCKFR